jgi:hypothetical protein
MSNAVVTEYIEHVAFLFQKMDRAPRKNVAVDLQVDLDRE